MEENKYTFENPEFKNTYRHTTSHILAQAVKRLYPEVKLAIGPAIENGFYYDFDAPFAITPEILEKIEAEMRKICKEKIKLERFELPREEAIKFMEEREEPYKVELINDLPEDAVISFYKQGDFTDLCAGPHLDSTHTWSILFIISSGPSIVSVLGSKTNSSATQPSAMVPSKLPLISTVLLPFLITVKLIVSGFLRTTLISFSLT